MIIKEGERNTARQLQDFGLTMDMGFGSLNHPSSFVTFCVSFCSVSVGRFLIFRSHEGEPSTL